MYDYGQCDICNTLMTEVVIRQDFWIKNKLVVIENIPAGVCPQCGEKIVNADVGKQIARILKDKNRISKAPTIPVPIVHYEEKVMAF
ncbi:MAG: YgiT-type zinc finger protein [Candidatus Aminicenantes bacterium]|nr:YgiT-type zinc finger protein [Candidatus Aminicenantes bacterium]